MNNKQKRIADKNAAKAKRSRQQRLTRGNLAASAYHEHQRNVRRLERQKEKEKFMFKGFLGIVDEGMGPDPIIVKLTDFQKTNCQVPTNLVVGDKYCVEWMGYDAMFNVEYFEGTDDEVKNHLSKLADSEGCNCDAGKCCCKDCSAKDSSFIDEILQGSTEPWPDDQVYRDSVSLQKI